MSALFAALLVDLLETLARRLSSCVTSGIVSDSELYNPNPGLGNVIWFA
jgi:hypothetical protein